MVATLNVFEGKLPLVAPERTNRSEVGYPLEILISPTDEQTANANLVLGSIYRSVPSPNSLQPRLPPLSRFPLALLLIDQMTLKKTYRRYDLVNLNY